MLVDDNRDIANVYKVGLEKFGFSVDAYPDPDAAIGAFRPGVYDLVLLDVRMPGKTGFEVYGELIKFDDGVRVCFITAFEGYLDEFRKLFPSSDVDCFIQKPIGIERLAATISGVLDS
jgi:DNA-binding response OmpR family regulator